MNENKHFPTDIEDDEFADDDIVTLRSADGDDEEDELPEPIFKDRG